MKNMILTIVGLLVILCSSCYTYKIYPTAYRTLTNINPKRTAYVINDTLAKEFKILRSSQLFNITTDSDAADLSIKLYPIKKRLVCGQAFTVSMFTAGQFPVIFPDTYLYKFDEIENGQSTKREIELKIAQRVWFWDMLVFNKRFEEKAGKAVLGEYNAIKQLTFKANY